MGRAKYPLAFRLTLKVFLLFASSAWAQVDVGDYTISGSAEIGGLPRTFKGDKARFEEYRDIPESVIVPQLQLMIGGKKRIFISILTRIRLDSTIRTTRSAPADTAYWIWNFSGIKFPTCLVKVSPAPLTP